METIILASGSLRRQEYFKMLKLPFSIMVARLAEDYSGYKTPKEAAEGVARQKVEYVSDLLKDRPPPWIFSGDTIISVDGDILGKPKDR